MKIFAGLASLFVGVTLSSLGCDGGGGGGGGGSGGAGGAGGQTSTCGSTQPVSYDVCTGTPFIPDGSCTAGSCAVGDPAAKIFAAWRAKTLALSGLSEQELDKRVLISTVEIKGGLVTRIEYVVALDWARSRQADVFNFTGAASPPTDADIEKAINLGVEEPEWTSLGAIVAAASEAKVQAAFDSCQCDVIVDWCHIDFLNVSGALHVDGIKQLNAATNECLLASVDVATGALLRCDPTPCAIN